MLPLTLTILSAAVPASKRGLPLGAWGGISGLAVALGPVVGGAIVRVTVVAVDLLAERAVSMALVPLARTRLAETRGPFGSSQHREACRHQRAKQGAISDRL